MLLLPAVLGGCARCGSHAAAVAEAARQHVGLGQTVGALVRACGGDAGCEGVLMADLDAALELLGAPGGAELLCALLLPECAGGGLAGRAAALLGRMEAAGAPASRRLRDVLAQLADE